MEYFLLAVTWEEFVGMLSARVKKGFQAIKKMIDEKSQRPLDSQGGGCIEENWKNATSWNATNQDFQLEVKKLFKVQVLCVCVVCVCV